MNVSTAPSLFCFHAEWSALLSRLRLLNITWCPWRRVPLRVDKRVNDGAPGQELSDLFPGSLSAVSPGMPAIDRLMAQAAYGHGLITDPIFDAIHGLTTLRNLATHRDIEGAVDRLRALEFVDLADAVLCALRWPEQSPPERDPRDGGAFPLAR